MSTHEQKLAALRAYLEWHCVGWEARQTTLHIANALTRRGYRVGPAAVQRIGRELMMSGVAVVSDDSPRTGGMFIAASARELDDYIRQLDQRITGLLERRNCARKLRDERFPTREHAGSTTAG